MAHADIVTRVRNRCRRFIVSRYGRRDFRLRSDVPYVSFTFDDFPRTAYTEGGRILQSRGARGTYFVSFGLLGRPSISGQIADVGDLRNLVRDGHELGCHTFEHLDGTRSSASAFRRSIAANRMAVANAVPGARLPFFAYPLDGPVLNVKKEVSTHFVCCRGGGQSINVGTVDLNLLDAFFIDWKSRDDIGAITRLIDENAASRGWLIFATHDVSDPPSDYGCSPELFEKVVALSCNSGARVLPMTRVLQAMGISA